MLLTGNYGLKKPDLKEPVDVRVFNDNADIIDTELRKRPTAGGDVSEMTVEFVEAKQLTALTSKDSLKGLFGKLALLVKTVLGMTEEMTALKKSVSDGKSIVANAITGQGVPTAATAAFQTMADNITAVGNNKYNAGMAAADNRVNVDSTNYQIGYNNGYHDGGSGKLKAEMGTATLTITQSGGGSGDANKVTINHSAHSQFAYFFPDRMWFGSSANTDMISVYVEAMSATSITLHAVANGFAGGTKTMKINWIAYE